MSPGTVSDLNGKAFAAIEEWHQRPLEGGLAHAFVDGIYLQRSRGGSHGNVAVLVAVDVNASGDRETIDCSGGYTESGDSWREFFSRLKERGLSGVRLVTGDRCAGMLGALEEMFPEARYRRRTVHFYRNALGRVPVTKRKAVAAEFDKMKLATAARTVRDGFKETLTYTELPPEHRTRIRTNNGIGWINREVRRRTRVVGTFPDGSSALMLVTARLKYIADHEWGKRRCLDMSKLEEMDELKKAAAL